ncbi:nucleotidyltransferase family protein [Leptospira kanakyensis]|uniref:nucleotidyltransferase family protein n=1 Tax=Leptospira kanakyensis TaxID=2484968 RepID=UPI00223D729A|nr:sugar phosphate nucleotidyltransferase [Leptospira kanakyensis]MCW7470802.1 sugar phosphate nucleotidyltransferase [Leptospira kanakyensis]
MKKIRIGVIAAAGKGTRAYPRTSFIPKPLFVIEGKSILHRNVELMVKTFGIEKVYVLVGHLKEQIIAEIDHIRLAIPKVVIEPVDWTKKGLASDVASLERTIHEPFLTILGDEFYYRTDHDEFLKVLKKHPNMAASIGIVKTSLLSRIRKNYSVVLENDKIVNLVEKPENPPNELLGLGSYYFTPEYFEFFKKTPASPKSGVIEITDVIDKMAKESKSGVYATTLSCDYFNINSMQDYYHAVYEVRNDLFHKFKTSLVIPTNNNERSITDVIVDFKDKFNEIIVIDNESTDETLALSKKEKVKTYTFPGDGDPTRLGEQVRRGIEYTTGDIIVVVSPDGSFRSKDFPKLLEYMKDSDMVIGTRTTRQMIEQGSNLKPLYRLVNLLMGKLVEVFWWGQEPRFTDVDCQFFSVWRESYERVKPQLHTQDRKFIVELMIDIVRSHMRCIEIPVSYFKPVGQVEYRLRDMITDSIHIMKLILSKKFYLGEDRDGE